MNEMDLKFSKSLFFLSNAKFQNPENAIRWPWCLPSTYLKQCALSHKLFLEYVLELKKMPFSSLQSILNRQAEYPIKTYISVIKFNECHIE